MTGPDFSGGMCRELIQNISAVYSDIPIHSHRSHEVTQIRTTVPQIPVVKPKTGKPGFGCIDIDYPPSLEYYNMSDSIFLNVFPVYNLYNTLSMRRMDFSGNGVKRFESGLVFVNRSIYNITLDISRNEVVYFSPDFFQQGSDSAYSIEAFSLRRNKLGDQVGKVGCKFLKNLKYLKYVDLSDNLIKTLPIDAFQDMEYLEHIILANNSLRNVYIDFGSHRRLKKLDLSNNLHSRPGSAGPR